MLQWLPFLSPHAVLLFSLHGYFSNRWSDDDWKSGNWGTLTLATPRPLMRVCLLIHVFVVSVVSASQSPIERKCATGTTCEQNVSLSKQMHALTHPLLSSTWSPMDCKRDSFGYSVVFVLAFHSGGKSNSLFELGEQKASLFPSLVIGHSFPRHHRRSHPLRDGIWMHATAGDSPANCSKWT